MKGDFLSPSLFVHAANTTTSHSITILNDHFIDNSELCEIVGDPFPKRRRLFTVDLHPASQYAAMGNKPSSPIQSCLDKAVKDVVFSSDPLFQLAHVRPYNLGVPSKPSAVTYPKSTDEIAKIVKCAVDNSLKVQPRGGGHSYANYGQSLLFSTSLKLCLLEQSASYYTVTFFTFTIKLLLKFC